MADTKLTALTAASALDGTELLYGSQVGASRKITGAQVKTYTSASPTLTGSATITGGTVTASTPVINATQTWNNVAVTFSLDVMNATDTTSAAGSLVFDRQVGGVSVVNVTKAGTVRGTAIDANTNTFGNTTSVNAGIAFYSTGTRLALRSNNVVALYCGSGENVFPSDTRLVFSSDASGGGDAALTRVAAGVLKVTNNSTGASAIGVTPVAIASLMSAATAGNGARAHVTDALAPTFGATVSAGGAVSTPVYSDGTNWKVG